VIDLEGFLEPPSRQADLGIAAPHGDRPTVEDPLDRSDPGLAEGLVAKQHGSLSGGPAQGSHPGSPGDGLTIIFADYTPGFASNSLVNGVLTASVRLDLDSETPTVTIVFEGDLVVTGEHAGEYFYDATLIIDLTTGEYTYSEYIIIDGKVHKTG
jgi:hypothetical protein